MPKNKHAQALGRKGGKARAAKLTPEQRSLIAKQAAEARWIRALIREKTQVIVDTLPDSPINQ